MQPSLSNHPQIEFRSVADLRAHPQNPRRVTKSQISAAKKAIQEFDFNTPLLLDSENQVIAGHWRLEAAKALELDEVPVLVIDHLDDVQVRAFQIAENRQAELGKWDQDALAQELGFLLKNDLGFDLEATGFDLPEIEFRVDQAITLTEDDDPADELPANEELQKRPYDVQPGDLWACGEHRILCGDSLDGRSYEILLNASLDLDTGAHSKTQTIDLILTDPPYNVAISGHVSTKRKGDGHREFAMAVNFH